MHELSIANSLIDIATEHLKQESEVQVKSITLRIGELSCVHQDALKFSFELVTENTLLEGAELKIVKVPVVVFCPSCDQLQTLPSIQKFRCPTCDQPTADIREGKELEIESIEVMDIKVKTK